MIVVCSHGPSLDVTFNICVCTVIPPFLLELFRHFVLDEQSKLPLVLSKLYIPLVLSNCYLLLIMSHEVLQQST